MSAQRPKSILRNSYSSPNTPAPLPNVSSHLVIHKIKSVLRRMQWRFEDQIDMDQIQDMINTKDLASSMIVPNPRVFGASIRDVYIHASIPTVIGSFRHQIPIVVVACVEELYRTGMHEAGLFRVLPRRERHITLVKTFNSPLSSYGVSFDLRSIARPPELCSVLSTFITQLPEAILPRPILSAFWAWCVKPSIKRENIRREHRDDRMNSHGQRDKRRYHPSAPSGRVRPDSLRKRSLQGRDSIMQLQEEPQVIIAALLLRLIPRPNYSLFVYLLAFFAQLPLFPENGVTSDDVGNMYGHKIVGGPSVGVAAKMTAWLLDRWTRISGVLIAEEEGDQRIQRASGGKMGSEVEADHLCRISEGSESLVSSSLPTPKDMATSGAEDLPTTTMFALTESQENEDSQEMEAGCYSAGQSLLQTLPSLKPTEIRAALLRFCIVTGMTPFRESAPDLASVIHSLDDGIDDPHLRTALGLAAGEEPNSRGKKDEMEEVSRLKIMVEVAEAERDRERDRVRKLLEELAKLIQQSGV